MLLSHESREEIINIGGTSIARDSGKSAARTLILTTLSEAAATPTPIYEAEPPRTHSVAVEAKDEVVVAHGGITEHTTENSDAGHSDKGLTEDILARHALTGVTGNTVSTDQNHMVEPSSYASADPRRRRRKRSDGPRITPALSADDCDDLSQIG